VTLQFWSRESLGPYVVGVPDKPSGEALARTLLGFCWSSGMQRHKDFLPRIVLLDVGDGGDVVEVLDQRMRKYPPWSRKRE